MLFDPTHTDTTNRWINRVTIRGNRLNNIQRGGITAQKVKTLFIEGNEFFGLDNANVSGLPSTGVEGIYLNQFGGEVTIRDNKFLASATGDTIDNCILAENPILSTGHRAQLYISEDNIFKFTVRNKNINIPSTITTTGLFEYGSLEYLADTLSTGTTFRQFVEIQNRPRSTTTIKWAADSLTITNAGHYRVSGQVVVASQDPSDNLILGVSINNAAITDNGVTTRGYLGDSAQFHTIPFNFFLNLSAGNSIKLKFRITSGTSNIYISRGGWLTVERLN